jgi:hypothetical protein
MVKEVKTVKITKASGKKFALIECGYTPDGKELPPEYLIKITSIRNRCTVISPIQEPLQMRVESRWEPFVPTSLLNAGNVMVQLITASRRSLITKATSRRLWQGSSPLTLSLNLRFEAVDDPFMEVVEPVRYLQSIALPSDPSGGQGLDLISLTGAMMDLNISGAMDVISKAPFLSPPGPTPFTLEGILNIKKSNEIASGTEIIEGLKGGDKILVEVGRFLSFYNVVVKEVTPTFAERFTSDGYPISATVNIIFETYEMMTVESLEKTYTQKELPKISNG